MAVHCMPPSGTETGREWKVQGGAGYLRKIAWAFRCHLLNLQVSMPSSQSARRSAIT